MAERTAQSGYRVRIGDVAAAVLARQADAGPETSAMFLRLAENIDHPRVRIVALVPAHNEEEGLGPAIESLLAQTRPLDEILVISDNSTDRTVAVASGYPVTVLETQAGMHPAGSSLERAGCCRDKASHRKSGALNMAWQQCQDADIVVCIDGDTMLPPTAVEHWEREFAACPELGGSSSRPIMTGHGLLPRMQRLEFSKGARLGIARGWAQVISGTGCAYRNAALREVARVRHQEGPWTYESVVEDYHLTYQLRRAGWHCRMSETVYCYTGSMTTLRSLWHQRIKWTAGTIGDLLSFGIDRYNYRVWLQQAGLFVNISFWIMWMSLTISQICSGGYQVNWWWQAMSVVFAAIEVMHTRRVRGHDWKYDWKDIVLAALLIHLVIYNVLAISWGLASWWKALSARMGDLWTAQYRAEGMTDETEMKIGVGS